MNSKSKTYLKIFAIILGLFVLFSLFINPIEVYKQTYFYIFQGRDIERARFILQGQWIFFGPEMTGGGNLPGPMYYILLAFGLLFKSNWISSWCIQYLLAFIGALSSAYYFRKSSPIIYISAVILIATTPFTAWFLKVFLNTDI